MLIKSILINVIYPCYFQYYPLFTLFIKMNLIKYHYLLSAFGVLSVTMILVGCRRFARFVIFFFF